MVGFADVELFNVELFLAKNKGKAGMIEQAQASGAMRNFEFGFDTPENV